MTTNSEQPSENPRRTNSTKQSMLLFVVFFAGVAASVLPCACAVFAWWSVRVVFSMLAILAQSGLWERRIGEAFCLMRDQPRSLIILFGILPSSLHERKIAFAQIVISETV